MALLESLLEATVAVSAALLLVLLLRRPLRKAFGARVAYAAWGLVPALLLSVLLPAAERDSPVVPPITITGRLPQLVAAPAGQGVDLALLLATLWLAGLAASAAWMAIRQARFHRSLGRLHPASSDVRVAEREVEGLPATIGFWTPRVVLPPTFELRYDATQRELMLAHERAHVRRGDVKANAVAAALRCLFWFNPLLSFAAPRFRQDQELACDATVLDAHPHVRRRYGEALLQTQLAAQATPLGCHFGFGHPLKERIAMLGEQLPSTSRRLAGAAFIATLASGLAFAAWAAQPQDVSTPAEERDIHGVSTPPPMYPGYAFEHNLEGLVVLRVDVAADGSVTKAVVERSEPKGVFDQAAMEAVRHWKFNPALKDGEAIAGQVRVPIEFKLDPKQGEEAAPMQMPDGRTSDPADYDWIKQDPASMGALREVSCDVIKLDAETGVNYCGIRRK